MPSLPGIPLLQGPTPTLLPRMEEGATHTHTPQASQSSGVEERDEQGGWGQLSELRSRMCWNVQRTGEGAGSVGRRAEETQEGGDI